MKVYPSESVFLLSIIFILSLSASCRSSSLPEINKEPAQKAPQAKTPEKTSARKYVGCWLGLNQGNIAFSDSYIYDWVKDKKAMKKIGFKELEANDTHVSEVSYLIEMNTEPKLGCLDKYNLIEFRNNEDIIIYRYASFENYSNQNFSGYCNFIRIGCQ